MSPSRLNLEAESIFDVFVAHHPEWEVSNSFVVFRDPNYGHRDSKLPKFSSIFQQKELRKKSGANRAWRYYFFAIRFMQGSQIKGFFLSPH
jgi:predicted double-glycine peptidase